MDLLLAALLQRQPLEALARELHWQYVLPDAAPVEPAPELLPRAWPCCTWRFRKLKMPTPLPPGTPAKLPAEPMKRWLRPPPFAKERWLVC